ncbi:MAG: 50S ribosome-binding GTPase [Gloeomargaritaceae cyanobacterium C42_A2020_066]|nr:50S ribosome-binding GTPase [Gloeomargaritaceae cyanobacterium C42_A2020_066]
MALGRLGEAVHASVAALLDAHPEPWPDDVEPERVALSTLLARLDQPVPQVVAVGLVSRGKSSLLNALAGRPVFAVGPTHGITAWPHTLRSDWGGRPVDWVDTPGFDDAANPEREAMTWAAVRAADLVLWLTAGPPTPREVALWAELRRAEKPVVIVLHKQDRFPDWRPADLRAALGIGEDAAVTLVCSQTLPEPGPPAGRATLRVSPSHLADLHTLLDSLLSQPLVLVHLLVCQRRVLRGLAAARIAACQGTAGRLRGGYLLLRGITLGLGTPVLLGLALSVLLDLGYGRFLGRLYQLPFTSHGGELVWRQLGVNLGLVGLGWGLGLPWTDPGMGWGISAHLVSLALNLGGGWLLSARMAVYLQKGATWAVDGPDYHLHHLADALPFHSLLGRFCRALQVAE